MPQKTARNSGFLLPWSCPHKAHRTTLQHIYNTYNNTIAIKKGYLLKPLLVYMEHWLQVDMRRRQAIRREKKMRTALIRTIILAAILLLVTLATLLQPYTISYERQEQDTADTPHIKIQTAYAEAVYHVTGYNTVPEQTDSTPCIAASGANICGRRDVVACPRAMPLGTEIEIDGKRYVCEDRLAPKYDDRIDVSCDKDTECPAKVTGVKRVRIY